MGGTSSVPAVERELTALIPRDVQYAEHSVVPVAGKADAALKPISIALGVFGAVALLAALLIATQVIARRFRTEAVELGILRALGAGPLDTVFDVLIGLMAAILVGSLLAVLVAVALSPVAPLGPVRSVYPTPGLSFDGTVLLLGALLLFARQIYAVPYPAVSVGSLVLVAAGTVVLANVVAAIPARAAARTPTALMLRAE